MRVLRASGGSADNWQASLGVEWNPGNVRMVTVMWTNDVGVNWKTVMSAAIQKVTQSVSKMEQVWR